MADVRPGSRTKMRVYYGQGGNRHSERDTQLDVRQRMAHTLRVLLGSRDWRTLPRGAG